MILADLHGLYYSHQLQEMKVLEAAKKRELEILAHKHVPMLLKELGSLQCNHVLTGDYCLKLARQQYFISNQEQVGRFFCSCSIHNE